MLSSPKIFLGTGFFLINMPLGLIVIYILVFYIPEVPPPSKQNFDYIGSFWLVFLSLLLFLLTDKVHLFSYDFVIYITMCIIGLYFFLNQLKIHPYPIFDLSLIENITFRIAGMATFLQGGSFIGSMIFIPLFLMEKYNISALSSSFLMLPLTLGIVIGSFFSGRLASNIGRYKILLLMGTGSVSLIFLVLGLLNFFYKLDLKIFFLFTVLLGLGFGSILPLYILAVQNTVSFARIGTATGFVQFFRQLGSSIGVSFLGLIHSYFMNHHNQQNSILVSFAILMIVSFILVFTSIIITFFLPDLYLKKFHN